MAFLSTQAEEVKPAPFSSLASKMPWENWLLSKWRSHRFPQGRGSSLNSCVLVYPVTETWSRTTGSLSEKPTSCLFQLLAWSVNPLPSSPRPHQHPQSSVTAQNRSQKGEKQGIFDPERRVGGGLPNAIFGTRLLSYLLPMISTW